MIKHKDSEKNFVSKLPNGEIIAIYLNRDEHQQLVQQNIEQKDTIVGILNSLNSYVSISNFNGELKFVNSTLLSALNYSQEEIKTKTVFDIRPVEFHDEIENDLYNFITGQSRRCNVPFIAKDGTLIQADTEIYIGNWQGEKAIFAFASDLTETEQLNNILNIQIEALKAAANGIVITDNKGQIIWTNPAFTKLTGYSAEEVKNENPNILKSGLHDTSFYKNLWSTISAGEVWRGKIKNKKKDGSIYSEEMIITPVKDYNGEITNYIAIKQDITKQEFERKKRGLLLEIGKLAISTNNLYDLLKEIHNKIREMIPAENCYVALYDPEKDLISFPYFVDQIDEPPKPRTKKKGFTEYVLKTGEPLIYTKDLYEKLVEKNEVDKIGSLPASWIGVPFFINSIPSGVLAIQSYDKKIIYSEEDKELLASIVNQTGLIIERKLMEEKLAEEQQLFQIFMDNIPESVYFKDINGRFLKINKVSAERVGLKYPSEAKGKQILTSSIKKQLKNLRKIISN